MINITYGNPIPLRIQLERGGIIFDLSKCTNITVTIIGPGVSKKANDTRIDSANGFIYVTIPASSRVGMYGIEITGKIDDIPWRAKYNKIVEITDSTVLGGNDAIYNGTGDYYDVVISVRLLPTNSFDWVQSDWSVIDETDPAYIKNKPTIPYIYAWATQPAKPHYTAEEVGALPVSTIIPTKTSDLINDSGFVTEATGGGDENVIETIKVNSVTLPVSDKTVDITIPTDLKDLVDDSTHRLDYTDIYLYASFNSAGNVEISPDNYYVLFSQCAGLDPGELQWRGVSTPYKVSSNTLIDDYLKVEGFEYYDTTLKKKVLWNGTDWVNVDGTPLTNS